MLPAPEAMSSIQLGKPLPFSIPLVKWTVARGVWAALYWVMTLSEPPGYSGPAPDVRTTRITADDFSSQYLPASPGLKVGEVVGVQRR